MGLPGTFLVGSAFVLLLGTSARAQGVPSSSSEPRAVEVDVQSTDGGQGLSAEDALRLGLSPDAVVRGLRYLQGCEGRDWLVLEGSADGEVWRPLTRTVVREVDSPDNSGLDFLYSNFIALTQGDSPFADLPLALGNQEPLFLEVLLEDGGPVRFVRLSVETLTFGGGTRPVVLSSLAELSVFE